MNTLSKGYQTKFWDGRYFIKVDSPGWYESISEILASEVQRFIVDGWSYVDYEYMEYKGLGACRSKNFVPYGYSVVSLKSLLDASEMNIDYSEDPYSLKNIIVGIMNVVYDINIENYLSYMIYLDALLLNEDRHLRNISFLRNSKGRIISCPIYDFGLGLLSSYNDVIDYSKILAQPFNLSFVEQCKMFDNPNIKINREGLVKSLKMAYNNPKEYVSSFNSERLKFAIKLLVNRLKETEGVLWTRV